MACSRSHSTTSGNARNSAVVVSWNTFTEVLLKMRQPCEAAGLSSAAAVRDHLRIQLHRAGPALTMRRASRAKLLVAIEPPLPAARRGETRRSGRNHGGYKRAEACASGDAAHGSAPNQGPVAWASRLHPRASGRARDDMRRHSPEPTPKQLSREPSAAGLGSQQVPAQLPSPALVYGEVHAVTGALRRFQATLIFLQALGRAQRDPLSPRRMQHWTGNAGKVPECRKPNSTRRPRARQTPVRSSTVSYRSASTMSGKGAKGLSGVSAAPPRSAGAAAPDAPACSCFVALSSRGASPLTRRGRVLAPRSPRLGSSGRGPRAPYAARPGYVLGLPALIYV